MIAVKDFRAEKIQELAASYAAEGYEVTVAPHPEDLPFDLDGYLPDLIARKGDGGKLFHVRTAGRQLSVDRLIQAVDEVRRHPGWGFILVTADDVGPDGVPGQDDVLLPWDELRKRASAAITLAESGDAREPAFLALWATLEGLLRTEARRLGIPVERLPSSALIHHLYSHGGLSMNHFDRALELLEVRNRVVYGYEAPGVDEATRDLAALVKELLQEAMEQAA